MKNRIFAPKIALQHFSGCRFYILYTRIIGLLILSAFLSTKVFYNRKHRAYELNTFLLYCYNIMYFYGVLLFYSILFAH